MNIYIYIHKFGCRRLYVAKNNFVVELKKTTRRVRCDYRTDIIRNISLIRGENNKKLYTRSSTILT